MSTGGTDKFRKSAHSCRTPLRKKAGRVHMCKTCGAVYTCKEVKGRLTWLMTRDGRKL